MADLSPVKIQLVANGIENIKQAFQSIEQSAKKLEESLTRTRRNGASQRNNQTKREEQENTRIRDSEAKKREAAQEREFQKLARQAEKWRREEVAAEKRKNAQIEADAKRSANARERFFRNVGRGVANTANKVIGLAGTVAAVGGGVGIVQSLGQSVKNQGKAKEISLNAGGAVSKQEVYSTAQALGAKGFNTEDALEGIDQFIAKTGDAKMALKVISDLGDTANATGADIKDLSTMTGLLYNSLSDIERAKGPEHLMKLVRGVVAQGRAGAIDVRELAGYGTRIFNTAGQFKGGVSENSQFIGALAQVAIQKGTATDVAEATESAKNLAMDVQTHHKKLRKAGFDNLVDKDGRLLDARTVYERLMVGTKGDIGKLHDVGIERQGLRAFEGPAAVYKDVFAASKKEGKTDQQAHQAALNASMKLLEPFIKAEISAAQMKKESAERAAETDKKLTANFNKLRDTIGDKLVPELDKVIPEIARLTPQIVKLLDKLVALATWVAQNPLKGAFIAVGALIAKEAAVAFAADALKKIFFGGVGGSGGGAAGAGGGNAAAVLAAGAGGVLAGISVTENTTSITNRDKQDLYNLKKRADDLWSNPNATKEEKEKALNDLNKKIDEQSTFGGRLKNNVGRLFDPKNAEAGDLWNLIPLFTAFNAAMGDKAFGGSGGTAEELKKTQEAFFEANKVNAKNNELVDENTKAMMNLTRAVNDVNLKKPEPPPVVPAPANNGIPNGPRLPGANSDW